MFTSSVNAASVQDQFLTLLTAQLRHQDPIEPVKQEAFLQQLAQFATLEGIEKLNARFDDMLKLQQLTNGASLVGQVVEYTDSDPSVTQVGLVDRVQVEANRLRVGIDGTWHSVDRIRTLLGEI